MWWELFCGRKGCLEARAFQLLTSFPSVAVADNYWRVCYNLPGTVMRSTAPFTEVAVCQWRSGQLVQSNLYQTLIKTKTMEVCTFLLPCCWGPQHWSASCCFCLFNCAVSLQEMQVLQWLSLIFPLFFKNTAYLAIDNCLFWICSQFLSVAADGFDLSYIQLVPY